MSQTPGGPSNPSDVYVAPPMAGGEWVEPPEPPKWPKVVGIISIVWGALGLCCNAAGIGSTFFLPGLMKSAAANMQGGMPPAVTDPNPIMLVAVSIGLVVSIFLIASGVVLVNRNPLARLLHLLYALLAIVAGAIGIYLQMEQQADIAEWMKANPDADFTKQQQATGALGSMIGLILGVVLGFAWPIFCLAWFGLVKKRPDDITGGVEEPAA